MARFDHINLEALVVNMHGDIKILNGYNLLYDGAEALYGDVNPYSDAGMEIFRAFTAEKGITYYGAPKEDFFEFEAYEKAEAEGNTYLLMDNMS